VHELSLTEGVVRILEEQSVANNFTRVKTVWLEIGELSHVDPESMAFCFEAVARGSTVASGARLEIVRAPGQAYCMDCGDTVRLMDRIDPCPRCGGFKLAVTGGEEMRVKELEVE